MTLLRKLVNTARGRRNLPEPCAFPPPYRAMLALNSDVEWTVWDAQLTLLHECAARGLETAFSFWLFGSPQITWRIFEDDGWPTQYARAAFTLAREGLLDTNHSIGGRRHLGGCFYDRATIADAYDLLAAEGVYPAIYTNHGSRDDRQNVAGDWADYQEGDLPGSDLYHLDLTLDLGARFFWCDPDYVDIPALKPELASDTGLFVPSQGRDGNPYLRFRRYRGTLPPGGPSLCNLETQLGQILDAGATGYTVVYQHLGVERHADGRPGAARLPAMRDYAAQALDRLKASQDEGGVLVTTTARLLRHAALMTARPWRMSREDGHLVVDFDSEITLGNVRWSLNWHDLAGWAIPARGIAAASARLNGTVRPLKRWTAGATSYFGFPWSRIDMLGAIAEAEKLTARDSARSSLPGAVEGPSTG